jgi:hypothetical protein
MDKDVREAPNLCLKKCPRVLASGFPLTLHGALERLERVEHFFSPGGVYPCAGECGGGRLEHPLRSIHGLVSVLTVTRRIRSILEQVDRRDDEAPWDHQDENRRAY